MDEITREDVEAKVKGACRYPMFLRSVLSSGRIKDLSAKRVRLQNDRNLQALEWLTAQHVEP